MTEHYWFGRTYVRVFGSRVLTVLPDGAFVNAFPNYDEASRRMAARLGYPNVEAMTREHDPLHARLCFALGLDESPALRSAVTGISTEASGADERMVLAAQELLNLKRNNG